jgi:predicted GIY-YIG superfamily endonuclease
MILKINELKNGMSVIYKINYLDGHYYIGLTNDLKRRMSEH